MLFYWERTDRIKRKYRIASFFLTRFICGINYHNYTLEIMKIPVLLSIISLILLTFGCAISKPGTTDSQIKSENEHPEGAVTDNKNYYRSLADYLHQIPGINISGPENNQVVTIRGISSFNSGIEPLFVIDGQIVGSNYSQVNNMINVWDIDYIRVLKGADAGIYGVRGGNGVILIITKK